MPPSVQNPGLTSSFTPSGPPASSLLLSKYLPREGVAPEEALAPRERLLASLWPVPDAGLSGYVLVLVLNFSF